MKKKILLIPLALLLAISLVATGCPAPAPPPVAPPPVAPPPVAPPPVAPPPVEEYPTRTITWVCPFGAGGATDRMARAMAASAIDYFGQPWHVVTMPGASGIVGWSWVLQQPADGYTVLQGTSTPNIALAKEERPPISPYDIKIACFFGVMKSVLVSQPGKPWSTWEGFVTYVEENPNVIVIGGTETHVMTTIFVLEQIGIADKVITIFYPDAPSAMVDLLGGHIHAAGVPISLAEPVVPEEAAAIILPGKWPVEMWPDVPTAAELNYEILIFPRWIGVHPDTPDEIADFISEKIGALLEDPSVVSLYRAMGEEIIYLPRAEAEAAYITMQEATERLVK